MYDAPSSFVSDSPFDAWWFYALPGGFQVCAATGRQVVDDVRATFSLAPTHVWDGGVQAALIARVGQLQREESAWADVLTALQADAAAQTVGPVSLAVGLYLAYYRPYGRQYNAVQVPAGAALPTWGVAPPASSSPDGAGRPVCWDPTRESALDLGTGTDLAARRMASSTGIRVYDASQAPPVMVPPGASGDVSNAVLVVGALALLGVAAYAVAKP